MPRLPRLRSSALADLDRHLQFAPPSAARRHLERIEALALQLLRDQQSGKVAPAYPADWVAFRITGMRPDASGDAPASLVREALLADLGALAQRLSRKAAITLEECGPPDWLTPADLETRWACSRKSIERLQRAGLVARRVLVGAGRERVVFNRAVVEMIEALHRPGGSAPGPYSPRARFSEDQRADLVRRARVYHRRFGWTLDRCAAHLAERTGRSKPAIRRVLERHDAASSEPIFVGAGAAPSPAKARRDLRLRRLERLQSLDLSAPEPDEHARRSPLIPPGSTDALCPGLAPPQPVPLGALLARAASPRELSAAQERATALARCRLMHDARIALASIKPLHPSAGTLDQVETTLRCAGRLLARLVQDELALVVRTIETQVGGPALSLGVRTLYVVARAGIAGLVDTAQRYDPYKGGRLAAPASLAVGRAVSVAIKEAHARAAAEVRPKAVARSASFDVDSNVWDGVVADWQRWLEPPPAVVQRIEGLGSAQRELLAMRLGLNQGPPRTLRSIAAEFSRPLVRVASEERAALNEIGWTP